MPCPRAQVANSLFNLLACGPRAKAWGPLQLNRPCKSSAPSTWPLAVRLLVITSSTAQNFEINARYGPMRRVTMTTVLLLVTWLAYGQPPSDYQVPFSSNEACEAARLQLIKDAERIGQSMIERATAQDRQIGGNNKTALLMAAISNAPYVSAVCVQTSAS